MHVGCKVGSSTVGYCIGNLAHLRYLIAVIVVAGWGHRRRALFTGLEIQTCCGFVLGRSSVCLDVFAVIIDRLQRRRFSRLPASVDSSLGCKEARRLLAEKSNLFS